jgi:outer membrane protein OmpA-like peptidoglycan-associated protein
MLLYPENKWAIDGHTDNTGTAEFNRMLSHERAQAVAVYLYKKGIKPTNLYVNGYGEDIPIADNATADGRKQNRRVEIEPIQ